MDQIKGTLFGSVWHRTWKQVKPHEHIGGTNIIKKYGGERQVTEVVASIIGMNIRNLERSLRLIGIHDKGTHLVFVVRGMDPARGMTRICREVPHLSGDRALSELDAAERLNLV